MTEVEPKAEDGLARSAHSGSRNRWRGRSLGFEQASVMVEAGMGLQPMRVAIADGQYTSTIYGWIKESKFEDVLTVCTVFVIRFYVLVF